MKSFIVYRINTRRQPIEGTWDRHGKNPQYELIHTPELVAFIEADDAQEACVKAANNDQRLGNYTAVETVTVGIQFGASQSRTLLTDTTADIGYEEDE